MAVPTATNSTLLVSNQGPTVIQLIGADADGTPLVFALTVLPIHGNLSGLNAATGLVTYTPVAGYLGVDAFQFTVTSGGQTSPAATVTITVTNKKTQVYGALENPDATPRKGKITFVLTQLADDGVSLIPRSSTVSALLGADGEFIVSLAPSVSLQPQSYYQAWFEEAGTLYRQPLGVYEVPVSATAVALNTIKITDTNLSARYQFLSRAALQSVADSITQQVSDQLGVDFGATVRAVNYHQKWSGTTVVNSAVAEDESGTILLLNDVQHKGDKLAFFRESPIVRPTGYKATTGLGNAQLELEVNELKYLIREYGLLPKTDPIPAASAPANTNFPLWFKADAITGLSDGNEITSWPSSGSGGSAATPGSAPNKPKYYGNVLNGKPAVRFNGSNGWLEFSEISGLRTVLVVMKHNTGTSATYDAALGAASSYDFAPYNGTQMHSGDGPYVFLGSARINGGSVGEAGYLVRPTQYQILTYQTTAGCRLGLIGSDRKASGRTWNGDVLEVMGSTLVLDATQLAEAENYLLYKYGIPANATVFFDGNSLTQGQGSTAGNDYVTKCLAALGTGWGGVNYGVGGQTTQQMTADAASQIDSQRVAGSKQIVVCWEGTNDVYVYGVSAATCYNNLVTYCTSRRSAGFKVVIATLLPRTNAGTPGDFETKRLTVNDSIRANWRTFADAIADVGSDSRIGQTGQTTNTTYYGDLVHLTNAGYAIVATWVKNALLSL